MDNSADKSKVIGWVLRCTECGSLWILEVSFDISDMQRLYHYCPRCGKNTFHIVVGRSDRVDLKALNPY